MSLLSNQLMADSVAGIYQDLEELLMRNIVRHIRDYGKPIDSDDWLLQKLAETGALNKENIRIIAQQAGISQTAAERMLNEVAQESIKQLEPCLQNATKDGLLHTAVDVDKSKNIKRTVEALQTQAKDSLNLCNTNMLYKAREAYKNLVQNICSASKEIEQKQDFIDLMNKNAANTVIGAESRTQAVRSCIKQFNEKGIPAFVDKAGREWTPEAYVNMCMRNTAKNVADEVQSERCKEYGCNLIEISSHSGARPKCSKDQGKIFDLDNGSGYTEDARGKKIRYYPWSSSSYGKPDGILGINCRHHKYPFVPGVNIKTYFPIDEEENDRLYEQTQVQRALERDVRRQKRECMLYDELGDTEAFEKAAVKLKSKEAKLKNYVDSNDNLHRRKDREQVVGFDKKVSSKAVQANKKNKPKSVTKSVAKSGESGIIDRKKTTVDANDISIIANSSPTIQDTKEFVDLLNNNSNDNIKRAYKYYSAQLNSVKYNPSRGCYRSNLKEISYGYPDKKELSDSRSKFSTLSHEYGHFIDDVGVFKNLNFREIDAIKQSVKLSNNLIKNKASVSDEFLKALRKDKNALSANIFDSTFRDDLFSSSASAGVQDAICGMFGTKRTKMIWQHKDSYYDRRYSSFKQLKIEKDIQKVYISLGYDVSNQAKVKSIVRDYETASEMWANIMSAETCGGLELEYVKKYLPNSYSSFLDIMKELK